MNTRWRLSKWVVALAALFAVVCGGVLFICAGGTLVGLYVYDDLRQNPARDFTQITGLQWPESAIVTLTCDDHSPPLGDGERHIVFDIDGNTMEKWLVMSPPWKLDTWQSGPIPDEISGNCSLRHDNQELLRLSGSPDTLYVAADVGPEALPWHNGRLLLLDPANNRVWLFVWNN
jgi:hypothetical protein